MEVLRYVLASALGELALLDGGPVGACEGGHLDRSAGQAAFRVTGVRY